MTSTPSLLPTPNPPRGILPPLPTATPQQKSSHKQDIWNAMQQMDAYAKQAQEQGHLLECLQAMEKSLILRGQIFGLDSQEVINGCRCVAEMCNYLAMSYLQHGSFTITLELLRKSEILCEHIPDVRAVTWNNMGCYYRKRGKLRTALKYVSRALALESKAKQHVKCADTHLNMCAILSELKRHDVAIIHARSALKLLLLELFGTCEHTHLYDVDQPNDTQKGQMEQVQASHEASATGLKSHNKPKLPADRVAVLAIAYHNLAVQQEFLRKYHDSLISYDKACKVVLTHLGDKHPLARSLSDSYLNAQRKLFLKVHQQQQLAQRGQQRRNQISITAQMKGTAQKHGLIFKETNDEAIPGGKIEKLEETMIRGQEAPKETKTETSTEATTATATAETTATPAETSATSAPTTQKATEATAATEVTAEQATTPSTITITENKTETISEATAASTSADTKSETAAQSEATTAPSTTDEKTITDTTIPTNKTEISSLTESFAEIGMG